LKDKRERDDMIEVYKLLTGREQIDCKQFFKPAQNHYGLRGHGMTLTKERLRLDTRKLFFSQSAINGWNHSPAAVVNAESVNALTPTTTTTITIWTTEANELAGPSIHKHKYK